MNRPAMRTTLFGIPNCNQVKQARVWLEAHGVAFTFHDLKKSGIDDALIELWLRDVAWDVLINRKGTTWRKLDEARRAAILDAVGAGALMREQPSIVKRPVLVIGENTHVGFSEQSYRRLFGLGPQ